MQWVWIAAMFGVFRFRGEAYWKWVAVLAIWILGFDALLYAGNIYDHIFHIVSAIPHTGTDWRIEAHGLTVVLLTSAIWIGLLLIARKMWRVGRIVEDQVLQDEWDTGKRVSISRKLCEASMITAVAATYFCYSAMAGSALAANNSAALEAPNNGAPLAFVHLVQKLADAINKQGPQQLDDFTKFVGASASGRVLTYHYEVSHQVSAKAMREYADEHTMRRACRIVALRNALEKDGLVLRFSFMVPGGDQPVAIDLTYKDCSALGLTL